MTIPFAPRRAARYANAAVAAALLLAACGTAPKVRPEPPIAPTTSTAEASAQLASVARERAAIEARFADREAVCYTRFFVNHCLDEAKETRRSALVVQRAIEVQAARYQRQAIVDERDQQMAVADKHFQEQEARIAAEPPKPPPVVKPETPARAPSAPGRIAQRDKRAQDMQRQEAADVGKRAQNVHDYEARKAQAEEGQRRVAQRKAEKAAKDAKQAADKARGAMEAAPSKKQRGPGRAGARSGGLRTTGRRQPA